MSILDLLQREASQRGLISSKTPIDLPLAFTLVRDMPYQRASSREPEVTIREWRGTCSGKHYLLKALFQELGVESELIACTVVTNIAPDSLHPDLGAILAPTNGKFVDVHNYLILHLPDGEMLVDATWPQRYQQYGLIVNDAFQLGMDQKLAGTPIESWIVPDDWDPQAFKDEKLSEHFTALELQVRDAFIKKMSAMLTDG